MSFFTFLRSVLCVLCASAAMGAIDKFDESLTGRLSESSSAQIPVLISLRQRVPLTSQKSTRPSDRLEAWESHRKLMIRARARFETAFLTELETKKQISAVKRFNLANAVALRANPETIKQLSNHPEVAHVFLDERVQFIPKPDEIVKRNEPEFDRNPSELPWGLGRIGIRALHRRGIQGEGATIYVLDTGGTFDHAAFAHGNVLRDKCMSFVMTESDPNDGHGHGTHCMGTSGGRFYGVAPKAGLVAVKVLDANGSGRTSDILAGMEYAVQQGADVVSMSLGSRDFPGIDLLEQGALNGVAAGTFFAIAAGNEGPEPGTIGSPGAASEVMTVGAINSKGIIAEFSSRGPTTDGLIKPDVSAPGVDVKSAWLGGKIIRISGTSMATPHVAGLAALIIGHAKSKKVALRPADVKRIIIETAAGTREENVYGAGTIDCVKALSQVPSRLGNFFRRLFG